MSSHLIDANGNPLEDATTAGDPSVHYHLHYYESPPPAQPQDPIGTWLGDAFNRTYAFGFELLYWLILFFSFVAAFGGFDGTPGDWNYDPSIRADAWKFIFFMITTRLVGRWVKRKWRSRQH